MSGSINMITGMDAKRFLIIAGAAAIVSVAAVGVGHAASPSPIAEPIAAPQADYGENGLIVYDEDPLFDRKSGIFRLDPVTRERSRILTGEFTDPRFSPDGSRIAFVSPEGVETANADGSDRRFVAEDRLSSEPFFLEDGRVGWLSGYPYKVKAAQPDGSELVTLGRLPHGASLGSISPDGGQVVYDSCLRRNCDIFILDTTTGENRRITRGTDWELNPSYSPKGDRIVYLKRRRTPRGHYGRSEVWMMRADGSKRHREGRTQGRTNLTGVEFSPDGRKLLVTLANEGPGARPSPGAIAVQRLLPRKIEIVYNASGEIGSADWAPRIEAPSRRAESNR